MKILICTLFLFAFLFGNRIYAQSQPGKKHRHEIGIVRTGHSVTVTVGRQLFTRFEGSRYGKPILYPVIGPGGIPMTRSWPMKRSDGEEKDHQHHRSIWIGHEVNGINFWSNTTGEIRLQEIEFVNDKSNEFGICNHWIRKDDEAIVVVERTTYHFGANEDHRLIDAKIVFEPADRAVVFEDSKEGLFAVRTHSDLRLRSHTGKLPTTKAQAINANGNRNSAIWGKSAKWVSYWGAIDNHEVGIAIFDHPANFRHPSTWHARDYGLIAVNPFGLHYFQRSPKGIGSYTIQPGDSLTLRYRIVFYRGSHSIDRVNKWYADFASSQ